MGYERSYAIVVSSWDPDAVGAAYEEASLLFRYVSPITPRAINGVSSFLIPTSGSKMAWPEAEMAESLRGAFRGWLMANMRYKDGSWKVNWIEVQYGDDGSEAVIIDASDRHPTGEVG